MTLSTPKKVAIGAGIFGALLIAGNGLANDKAQTQASGTSSTSTVVISTTVPVTTTVAGPKTSFGAGTYLVGTQIEAGTYQAPGGSNCYYERRSNTSSDFGGIIVNEWSTDKSQQIVTIDPSDVAFKSTGCGRWIKI